MGISEESAELNHWESDCDEQGERGFAKTNTWILADQLPIYNAQVVDPTSNYAHLQSRDDSAF